MRIQLAARPRTRYESEMQAWPVVQPYLHRPPLCRRLLDMQPLTAGTVYALRLSAGRSVTRLQHHIQSEDREKTPQWRPLCHTES